MTKKFPQRFGVFVTKTNNKPGLGSSKRNTSKKDSGTLRV